MNYFLSDPLTGDTARVQNNRLNVTGVAITQYELEAFIGTAFNINTEYLTIDGADGESALLYIKNDGSKDISLQGWFIGSLDLGGTPTEKPLMRVYFNPTGGTIISDQVAIDIVNRNAGASESFGDIIAYKASGSGKTFTGQDPTPVLYQPQNANARSFGNVFLTLPKGTSVVVTCDPNTTAGGTFKLYTGFTGFIDTLNTKQF